MGHAKHLLIVEDHVPYVQEDISIQSLGGKARAENLTPEELSAQGSKAAAARWSNRPIQAIRKGTFKKEFGTDVDCYVLGDADKTAVISQSGMARTLGFSAHSGGSRFTSFLSSQVMADFVGTELRDKLSQPIKFQWGTGGTEQPPSVGNGYDATLLIDICRAMVGLASGASTHAGRSWRSAGPHETNPRPVGFGRTTYRLRAPVFTYGTPPVALNRSRMSLAR